MDAVDATFSNLSDYDKLAFFNIFVENLNDEDTALTTFNEYLLKTYDCEELFITREDDEASIIAYKDSRVSIMSNSERSMEKMKRSIFDGAIAIRSTSLKVKAGAFKFAEQYFLSDQEYFLCLN